MAVRSKGRLERALWRVWLAASLVYVLAIAAVSVSPVRQAFQAANQPRPAPAVTALASPTGPIPDAPPSPRLQAYQVVGRQALIALGPPLLLLWFGWDAWFAVTGFLRRS